MNKYIITFLTTSLFLSLMLYVSEVECTNQLKKSYQLSDQIINIISDRFQEMELE